MLQLNNILNLSFESRLLSIKFYFRSCHWLYKGLWHRAPVFFGTALHFGVRILYHDFQECHFVMKIFKHTKYLSKFAIKKSFLLYYCPPRAQISLGAEEDFNSQLPIIRFYLKNMELQIPFGAPTSPPYMRKVPN